MDDTQFGILISAAVGVAGSFMGMARWAVNRITKSMDESTVERIKHIEALAGMSAKIDHIHGYVLRKEESPTPVHGIAVEHTERVEVRGEGEYRMAKPRPKTHPGSRITPSNLKTKRDDEER